MTDADLENRYRAYLDALNERPLGDLADYVQDVLTYNGEVKTRLQYQEMIAADIAASPDLIDNAHLIVASGDQVACRIIFACTPRRNFLGFSPNGERIVFAEHVFYRFLGDPQQRHVGLGSLVNQPRGGPAAERLKPDQVSGPFSG
jgi:predicted ester cyclase